jgi:hypothetical protein
MAALSKKGSTMSLYVGLVHHPIRNKNEELITTSVTNLDIHDISRSCRTFGVKKYFLITPLEEQNRLVSRILNHWEQDKSSVYNPDRHDALSVAALSHSVQEACATIEEKEGKPPVLVATGANFKQPNLTCQQFRERLSVDKLPYFLLFGTGWGIHATLLEQVTWQLEPLFGASADGYNHLSVRSAVAIYLDRLTCGL